MVDKKKKMLRVLTTGEPEKTVLPEVLPDPRRPATGGQRTPAPRARTLAHMQKLLATATAMGMSASACSKQQDPPKTTPIAPDGADGSTTTSVTTPQDQDAGVMTVASASAVPSTTTTAPATTSAKIPAPPLTPTGYAVVDPMPPPVHCPNVAPLVHATAKFVSGGGSAIDAIVHFPNPTGRSDYKYVKDAEAVLLSSGTVTKTEVKADGVTVTIRLSPDQTPSLSVSVKGACNKGPGTLTAQISWKGSAAPSTKPALTVYEH